MRYQQIAFGHPGNGWADLLICIMILNVAASPIRQGDSEDRMIKSIYMTTRLDSTQPESLHSNKWCAFDEGVKH
jgi:hypothetical protein